MGLSARQVKSLKSRGLNTETIAGFEAQAAKAVATGGTIPLPPPELIDKFWLWFDEHCKWRKPWMSKRVLGYVFGLVIAALTLAGVAIPAWVMIVAGAIFGAGVVTAKGPVEWTPPKTPVVNALRSDGSDRTGDGC